MNTSEYLKRAAEIIEERGWRQGVPTVYTDPFEDDDAPCCLMEAVDLAISEDLPLGSKENSEVFSLMEYELRSRIHIPPEADWGPMEWNDDSGTTKENVLAVLRDEVYAH